MHYFREILHCKITTKVGFGRGGTQAIQTTMQLKRRLTSLYPLEVLKRQRIINLIRGEDFAAFVINKITH